MGAYLAKIQAFNGKKTCKIQVNKIFHHIQPRHCTFRALLNCLQQLNNAQTCAKAHKDGQSHKNTGVRRAFFTNACPDRQIHLQTGDLGTLCNYSCTQVVFLSKAPAILITEQGISIILELQLIISRSRTYARNILGKTPPECMQGTNSYIQATDFQYYQLLNTGENLLPASILKPLRRPCNVKHMLAVKRPQTKCLRHPLGKRGSSETLLSLPAYPQVVDQQHLKYQ